MRKLILLISFCLLPLLAQAGVTGKGRAEIFNSNEGAAQKQALRNALRDAVQKGVGTILDSETEVKNWQVIRDEIYTSAKGYISKYDVKRDEKVGNVWHVEIEAEVSQADLEGKLKSLRILHKKMGNKRVMVIYRKENTQSVKRDHNAVHSALSAIQTQLNKQGFRVFDQKSVDRIYKEKANATPDYAANNLDKNNQPAQSQATQEWVMIAREQQVDILMEFEVMSSGSHQPGRMFQASKASVVIRVYDVSTGRLIANQASTQKQLTNARVGSFDWNESLSKAGQKAGRSVTEQVVKDVVGYYESVGDIGNTFFMRFTGFEEDREDEILGILENMEGFQNLSELTNSKELIEIEYFSHISKSRLRRKLKIEAKAKRIPLQLDNNAGNRFEYSKKQ